MVDNMETLAKSTGIADTNLLQGFVNDFFKICSIDVERILPCIQKGDNEAVIRHSHNIYGAAHRLSLTEIRQAAGSLYKAANNMETEKYVALYEELKNVFQTGIEEYKETA
mgnify:CR=1 FL=1